MSFSAIIGTGGYLPDRVVSNAELARTVDTSDEWIRSRTGIRERRVAAPDESTCDMAEQAARGAIAAAGLSPADLDFIVVATSTPDLIYPSTACLLQKRLGIRNGGVAFDVQAVCSGFVYATGIADQFIRAGTARHALVVGADANSKILDWSDRSTCVLFGDGAGAIVMGASDRPGVYLTRLHADGNYAHLLEVPSGVSRPSADPHIRMHGAEVFKLAVNIMGDLVEETLAAAGFETTDVDWLIPHQANERIISATARKLRMDMGRVIVTLDRHGNTSGASIPLALDTGIRDGRVRRGELLLLEAVGGGFTWGSVLLRY
ncbi:MAG: ketoacyl-ACP synthase III [Gammaproteobacteria bacterium]|nr:ketoacyl-ACP synthase III [Gammaproteobacteria bacterium]